MGGGDGDVRGGTPPARVVVMWVRRDKALRESASAWAFKTSLKKRKKAKSNVFGIRMYLECR